MSESVVLAYSGGLDTSVAIRWIAERYAIRHHAARKAKYENLSGFFNELLERCVRHLV